MDDHEGQKNKSHKGKTVGNKAAKRDALRKKRAGIDLEPNRGKNVKAFQGFSAGSHKAQKMLRSVEKREETLHMPTVDKTLSHIVAEPPLLVAVVGPPGVGKSTLIRSLIKFYTNRNVQHVRGAITVVAGRSRRITFLECPTTLTAMCDVAKVADLVLLMVDGNYGFEMETFEFLSIAQVHGFPKMFGVISHLDELKTNKALKKRKKFLRHRFWHEVAAGAKLLCLSPMIRGMYRPTDVLNLHRLLICVEPRVQSWRNTHSCVLVDRFEDVTDPAEVAQNANCDRTIAFYGYTRGKPMQSGQMVHIPGLGDVTLSHLSRTATDPCGAVDGAATGGGGGRVGGHRMRHLGDKHKKLYAPYCDVGGVVYDEDAIYVHEDAERGQIERTGPGVSLLRELQHATPMDERRQNAAAVVVRRPVVFRDEAAMELDMDDPTLPDDMDKPRAHRRRREAGAGDDLNSSSSDDDDEDEACVNGIRHDGTDKSQTTTPPAARCFPHAHALPTNTTALANADSFSSPQLAHYGLSSSSAASTALMGETRSRGDASPHTDADDDGGVHDDAVTADALAPRSRDADDSVRMHEVRHEWGGVPSSSEEAMPALVAVLFGRLKNLCVTGDWDAGKRRTGASDKDEDEDEVEDEEDAMQASGDALDKGYESTDEEFDAAVRGTEDGGRRRRQPQSTTRTTGDTSDTSEEEDYNILDDSPRSDDEDHDSDNTRERKNDCNHNQGQHRMTKLHGVHEEDDELQTLVSSFLVTDACGGGGRGGPSFVSAPAAARGGRLGQQHGVSVAFPPHSSHAGGADADVHADDAIQFYDPEAHVTDQQAHTLHTSDAAMQSAAVMRGESLTAEQERQMQRRMAKKRAFDDSYDAGESSPAAGPPGSSGSGAASTMKNMTYAHYSALQRKAEAKKAQLDAALREVGEELDTKIQLVGYFSGLYVRAVVRHMPVEFVRLFDPATPLLLGGVNAGEGEYRVVHARLKRHRWYPKILKAQDPLLLSMGWRRFQTQPIFAAEEANGRMRYLKYTPLHMHCVAAFYAPVAPPNTGFLAIPVSSARVAQFRLPCTGYTLGNDVTASVVKKLKITGTPAKVEKTTVFIKGMFSSDVEAAKFVGAKVKSVSGVRGIIKAALKGKQGLVRATFEDKLFASDIVFIRAWTPVEPPRYCSIQRNLVDANWVGMRSMRELRWSYGVPLSSRPDSEYTEIKRRQRGEEEESGAAEPRVLLSRNTRMQLPYDMKEEFIAFAGRSSELAARMTAATTVAPEPREQRRQALLDTFADRADAMRQKKDEAKQRARVRAQREAERENAEYVRGLKRAKKETARRSEFRSQHKSRSK